MRTRWLVLAVATAACSSGGSGAVDPPDAAVTPDGEPGDSGGEDSGGADGGVGPGGVPDVRCDAAPDAGPPAGFRHTTSELISALGGAQHRGFDLVASDAVASQQLEGWISYTLVDKALEDEDVDLFACEGAAWRRVGTARTDDEGHFGLALTGADRLAVGMRDLFVSVAGDRTGVRFLAYVAPANTRFIVSDVDGTLTSSENAFFETIVFGTEPDEQPGAPNAYRAATANHYQLVYVTARGNQFTTATRDWLAHKSFPRGPARLSPSFVTLPGGDTSDYKLATFTALSAAGFEIAAGVGNRASDIDAYAAAGLPADRIFIKLPEYADEVQPRLDAHEAIGFTTYDELLADHLSTLP